MLERFPLLGQQREAALAQAAHERISALRARVSMSSSLTPAGFFTGTWTP